MPRERMRIRDVACPDVVERCVAVPARKEDEVPVGVEDGGVRASGRRAHGGRYAGFAPAVGNWDGEAAPLSIVETSEGEGTYGYLVRKRRWNSLVRLRLPRRRASCQPTSSYARGAAATSRPRPSAASATHASLRNGSSAR